MIKGLIILSIPGTTPQYRNPTRRATDSGSSSTKCIEFSLASLKLPFMAFSKYAD